jgi:hypothetical protein
MKMYPPIEPEVPLIDNMFTPEILAGGLSGLSLLNGIITVTLENPRCDHTRREAKLERVVVGRLALPIPAAQAMLSGLYQFLDQHGINPLTGAPVETRQ